jgi:Family of unknown function (DUF5946)
MATERTIACIGCGGFVPDQEGPTHRYMLASPGCWEAYTTLLPNALGRAPVPDLFGALTVDAYAVQHPGTPNPQAIQSVWVHLVTLQLALEGGWPIARLVAIRRVGADSSAGLTWLDPPPSMGPVTAIDAASADPAAVGDVVRDWVEGAWAAWSIHHAAVRARAAAVERRLR